MVGADAPWFAQCDFLHPSWIDSREVLPTLCALTHEVAPNLLGRVFGGAMLGPRGMNGFMRVGFEQYVDLVRSGAC